MDKGTKMLIFIGVCALFFALFTFTLHTQLRNNYTKQEYTTTAEPSKSIEWYQAAGKRPTE